jgi:hypothetical protein
MKRNRRRGHIKNRKLLFTQPLFLCYSPFTPFTPEGQIQAEVVPIPRDYHGLSKAKLSQRRRQSNEVRKRFPRLKSLGHSHFLARKWELLEAKVGIKNA